MKGVLISIQPYYVFLIIARLMGWDIPQEKTLEVRKDFPKALEWNRVTYIYCSKNRKSFNRIPKQFQPFMEKLLGKVIGEFVCRGIMRPYSDLSLMAKQSCLTIDELNKYSNGKELYGWRIADLKIYDKPKELGEFRSAVKCPQTYCSEIDGEWYCEDGYTKNAVVDRTQEYPFNEECIYFDCPSVGVECSENEDYAYCMCKGYNPLIRPPQSWCYVEEFE